MNLLQPNDRRSSNPGDSLPVARARRTLFEAGVGNALLERIIEVVTKWTPDTGTMLDVGCGEGTLLHRLPSHFAAAGADISVPAIDLAARRDPSRQWVVCNADRFLPFAAESFDLVTAITSRVNQAEFLRVLSGRGVVVVAVAGPDDLLELREIIHGVAQTRDRVESLASRLHPGFQVVHRERVVCRDRLSEGSLDALLTTTYRGERRSEKERAGRISAMTVTSSRDVVVFGRRESSQPGSNGGQLVD